ncbi:MAG: hypothetical protein IK103_00425 [Bacteroidales bacterium]|nr:hypothetical protein [Bacteroidales bacterium]
MKRFLIIAAAFAVSVLAVCCKSNTQNQNQAQAPGQTYENTTVQPTPSAIQTPEAGTLTAYYATEDIYDQPSDRRIKKGDLISDDNDPFNKVVDFDADNYRFLPEEAEDGNVYGDFIFPKSKAEKKVFTQNQLTTELVGDRAVFKDKDGNEAIIFKSNRNGQTLYTMNSEKWEFEPAPEDVQKKYDHCYVITVHFSDGLFEEPLETEGDIIKLYQTGDDPANPTYRGSIEDGWYNKGDWDYRKSAYDEKGNLLVSQERTVDIPMEYSVAYIGSLDALYVNGILYYRVK